MHDVTPTGIQPHNPLPPRQGNGHTRHALSIQSPARPWPSIGYHYPPCLHNARLQGSFPASLHQQSRNASSGWLHYYWLAQGHQGSSSSPPPILATQRDSHHWGQSSPSRWSTHHPPAERERVLHQLHQFHQGIMKSQLLAHGSFFWPSINKAIKELVCQCETYPWFPESECCSASHTYTHTIMPRADVHHRYPHARRSWPPGSGWFLLKDDLCSMSSTQPEQYKQGCLTAERDVCRARHPQSPLLQQWPTICECPVCWLLYILGHNTWNLKSALPTTQQICWGIHQVCQTCTPMSQVQHCQSIACLASTPSYTHRQQTSIPSRAVVPVPTQNNHSSQDMQQWPISHTSPWADQHMLRSCQITGWQMQQNTCTTVCWSTICNVWHPQKIWVPATVIHVLPQNSY